MVLLERDSDLAGLNSALAEARAGAGRIALVSGEAGIGKTSLLERFAESHRSRTLILWGVCDSLFSPRPLGPLHDMAAQAKGVLAALLAADIRSSAIFTAVLTELQRATVIAVFEDVHWADEATLDLLRYLGRRITQTSSLLVLTYRDDELGALHPLRTLLGDLVSIPATRRIALAPLSERAVEQLTADRSLDFAALHRQTGGNPFFITEVLAGSSGSLPATIRDAVLARAARLSQAGYAMLEAAAVLGPRIEPALLATLAGEQAEAMDEGIAGGVLQVQGNWLAFRHELARQVILESISPSRRHRLHRQALSLLAAVPPAQQDLARLAHHAEAAGDGQAVLAYAPAAARQASAASAHREAAALYDLALRFASDLPPHAHARLLQAYAQECNSIDNRFLGVEVLRKALEIWRQLDDRKEQGAVLALMANMLVGLGQDAEAMQCAEQAVKILEGFPTGRDLAYAYRVQASLDMINLNVPEALAWAEKSMRISAQKEDRTEFHAAQTVLGSVLMFQDYERGCQVLEQTQAAADQAGQRTTVAWAYANAGSISCELHHFRRAWHYLNAGLAYSAKHDLDRLRYYMRAWLAATLLRLGRWDEAGEAAVHVLEEARRSVTSRLTALATLGRLRARRGDPQASSLLDEALESSRQMCSLDRLGLLRGARAEAAWLAGDLEQTRQEAQAVFELAIRKQHPGFAGELAFWLWRAGGHPTVTSWMSPPYALQIAGDWRNAALEWERLGCPYEQAWALADGDAAAQRSALEIFERLGARPAAEKLRQSLMAAGVHTLPRRPRQATRANPFGLTGRQVEILSLLTEGLSNAQIAERLHISAKTADHHVSAILERLEVHTRADAARLARQNPHFAKNREARR